MTMPGEIVTPERQLAAQAEICAASLEAARQIVAPLNAELSNPDSVLYRVVAERIAGGGAENQLGIAPLLSVDPMGTGVIVERYRMQTGELPTDATDDSSPERMVAMWASDGKKLPRLQVPEGSEPAVMTLADKLHLRGGGPVIFAREEVAQVPLGPNTLLHVSGAANNAPRERLTSALAYLEAHKAAAVPIIATVDPSRTLKDAER